MKNFPKAGLLIITLVIPALIFVMLRLFATNHYDLPYFNPQIASDGKIVITNGDTVFQKNTRIALASGKLDLVGEISVISFLPATCGDTCRLVFSNLKRVSDMRSEANNVVIKTLSEGNVADYSELPAEMGKAGWEVLKATNTETSDFFNAQSKYLKNALELYPMESRLVLIDRDGYTRGYYNGTDSEDIDRLMAEVKILNYENKASAKP